MKKQRPRRRSSENCGDARGLEKWWDCATLRNTHWNAHRRRVHPCYILFLGTLCLSGFANGRKKHERCFDRLFSPVSVSLPFSLSLARPFVALSLSLPRPPAGLLSLPHSFFIDSGLFVSFTPNGRSGRPCPTDEFIFVHAFRLRRQEIYAKSRSVRRIFERHGDYSYRWSLDEVLTASSLLAHRSSSPLEIFFEQSPRVSSVRGFLADFSVQ